MCARYMYSVPSSTHSLTLFLYYDIVSGPYHLYDTFYEYLQHYKELPYDRYNFLTGGAEVMAVSVGATVDVWRGNTEECGNKSTETVGQRGRKGERRLRRE